MTPSCKLLGALKQRTIFEEVLGYGGVFIELRFHAAPLHETLSAATLNQRMAAPNRDKIDFSALLAEFEAEILLNRENLREQSQENAHDADVDARVLFDGVSPGAEEPEIEIYSSEDESSLPPLQQSICFYNTWLDFYENEHFESKESSRQITDFETMLEMAALIPDSNVSPWFIELYKTFPPVSKQIRECWLKVFPKIALFKSDKSRIFAQNSTHTVQDVVTICFCSDPAIKYKPQWIVYLTKFLCDDLYNYERANYCSAQTFDPFICQVFGFISSSDNTNKFIEGAELLKQFMHKMQDPDPAVYVQFICAAIESLRFFEQLQYPDEISPTPLLKAQFKRIGEVMSAKISTQKVRELVAVRWMRDVLLCDA